MFQIGDQVVYGVHGICCVTDEERRCTDGRLVTYLSLEPVGQGGTKFLVPTHNAAAMAKLRPVLTVDQAASLLEKPDKPAGEWVSDEGRRKQLYRELISSGDCERLLTMVYLIYQHKDAQLAAGRKLHMCDENFLRDAERLLTGEIAFVMDKNPEEIRQMLRSRLCKTA